MLGLESVAYFNPAKTVGGMIEADIFCLIGFLYSAFVCLSSMTMFWWLESMPGWEWLGDLVAVLWVGVSMSIVAWFKVWMVCEQSYSCNIFLHPSFRRILHLTLVSSAHVTKPGRTHYEYSLQHDNDHHCCRVRVFP